MINPSQPERSSFRFSWVLLACAVVSSLFLGGCAGMGGGGETSNYHVTAYAPTSSSDVHVYVSLRSKMVYVMEGNRPLLVTPTSIGTLAISHADRRLPRHRQGRHQALGRIWLLGQRQRHLRGQLEQGRSGYHYVGYPMANWVGFAPGFGFHEGYVWPIPRSHGCLRIHKNVSVKFFKLVEIGTPVTIRTACPTTTRWAVPPCTRPTTRTPIRRLHS